MQPIFSDIRNSIFARTPNDIFPIKGGRTRMVPVGPKKGGGFVVVPLNYGGTQTKSKVFEDKSGTIHLDPMATADVRTWRTENTNGYLGEKSGTERIYTTLKNSRLHQKGYNVRIRQSKNFSSDSMANTADGMSRAATHAQTMNVQVNDSAEFVNFAAKYDQCPVITGNRRPAKTPIAHSNNHPHNHNISLVQRLNRQL